MTKDYKGCYIRTEKLQKLAA